VLPLGSEHHDHRPYHVEAEGEEINIIFRYDTLGPSTSIDTLDGVYESTPSANTDDNNNEDILNLEKYGPTPYASLPIIMVEHTRETSTSRLECFTCPSLLLGQKIISRKQIDIFLEDLDHPHQQDIKNVTIANRSDPRKQ